jgi:hypothetical protein
LDCSLAIDRWAIKKGTSSIRRYIETICK